MQWSRRQTYGAKKLVIVLGGSGDVGDLVPDDPDIRLIKLDGERSLGEKHNVAVECATHDWIAKWDDDDWHAPSRLEVTMARIRDAGAEIGGTDDLLIHELCGEKRTFRYVYRLEQPWLAGQTAVFRRSVWERAPFPDRASGVDVQFVWDALERAEYVKFALESPIYVLMEYGQSTGRKTWDPKPPEFVRCPSAIVKRAMGADYVTCVDAFREHRMRSAS